MKEDDLRVEESGGTAAAARMSSYDNVDRSRQGLQIGNAILYRPATT